MKKQHLLSALLGIASVLSLQQGVFAATSANQTIHATLGAIKSVVVAGDTQPSGGNIDGSTGALTTTIVPAFVVTSNASGTGTLHLYGKTAGVNGIAQPGGGATPIYIALGNTTNVPTAADVANAISATPTVGSNANVIAYTIADPVVSNIHGTAFSFTAWDNTNHWWPATVSASGQNHVANTVATAARANTFTDDDTAGSYEAVIYLDFT